MTSCSIILTKLSCDANTNSTNCCDTGAAEAMFAAATDEAATAEAAVAAALPRRCSRRHQLLRLRLHQLLDVFFSVLPFFRRLP